MGTIGEDRQCMRSGTGMGCCILSRGTVVRVTTLGIMSPTHHRRRQLRMGARLQRTAVRIQAWPVGMMGRVVSSCSVLSSHHRRCCSACAALLGNRPMAGPFRHSTCSFTVFHRWPSALILPTVLAPFPSMDLTSLPYKLQAWPTLTAHKAIQVPTRSTISWTTRSMRVIPDSRPDKVPEC